MKHQTGNWGTGWPSGEARASSASMARRLWTGGRIICVEGLLRRITVILHCRYLRATIRSLHVRDYVCVRCRKSFRRYRSVTLDTRTPGKELSVYIPSYHFPLSCDGVQADDTVDDHRVDRRLRYCSPILTRLRNYIITYLLIYLLTWYTKIGVY